MASRFQIWSDCPLIHLQEVGGHFEASVVAESPAVPAAVAHRPSDVPPLGLAIVAQGSAPVEEYVSTEGSVEELLVHTDTADAPVVPEKLRCKT